MSSQNDESNSQLDNLAWDVVKASEEDGSVLGFLQICIEKRFHRSIQLEFEGRTGLTYTRYWLHSDAGGSPMMEENTKSPNYCYYQMGARIMGWAAHGSNCGGFPPDTPDDEIQAALQATVRRHAEKYRAATHYVFFATERNNEPVVCCATLGPINASE